MAQITSVFVLRRISSGHDAATNGRLMGKTRVTCSRGALAFLPIKLRRVCAILRKRQYTALWGDENW